LLILLSLIQHQLLTKNQIYIFFIIPLFSSFAHIEMKNLFKKKKNYFNYFFIIITLFSLFKYNERFNVDRKFHELNYVDFSNSIRAEIISFKLKGLNWITPGKKNKESVEEEIKSIKSILSILKKDTQNKLVLTNYSFISVILGESNNGISRWYPENGSNFPSRNSNYYNYYKNFLISNIKKKNIENIYVLFDVSKKNLTEYINSKCLKPIISNSLFTKYKFEKNCYN